MLKFTESLDESLQQGNPVGQTRQHFTLFKELPTICFCLKKSLELEERQIEARNILAQRNNKRANAKKHNVRGLSGKKGFNNSFADMVRQQSV